MDKEKEHAIQKERDDKANEIAAVKNDHEKMIATLN
jgi:hypothetical protein